MKWPRLAGADPTLNIVPTVDWVSILDLASPSGVGVVAAFACSLSADATYLWQEKHVFIMKFFLLLILWGSHCPGDSKLSCLEFSGAALMSAFLFI